MSFSGEFKNNRYIEDMLENFNFASWQDLIDKKQFPGESEACKKFEEKEIVEVADDNPLGTKL